MELFGIGVPEIGVVFLIALIIVGPQRFPEVARQVARWIQTARTFSDAVMKDVRAAVDELEQEVTAANDGVNPIRELGVLREELTGAVEDATATVTDATTLPALASPDQAAPDEAAPGASGPPESGPEEAGVAEDTEERRAERTGSG